jgi:hypothetical protein
MSVEMISRVLTPEEMRLGVDALPLFLSDVMKVEQCAVMYGFGARFPLGCDYCWKPFILSLDKLPWFLQESREQRIFVPGEGDLHVEAPNRTLKLHFCHESDIHVRSESQVELNRFVSAAPYAEFGFTEHCGALTSDSWMIDVTSRSCTVELRQQDAKWVSCIHGSTRTNLEAPTKDELVALIRDRLAESLK